MMQMIAISEVFAEIKANGSKAVFAITYYKKDGSLGQKQGVQKIFVSADNAILNRTVNFLDLEAGTPFRIRKDFWRSYNSQLIDHRA